MSITSTELLFHQLADGCITGKKSKEQALQQLLIIYNSVYKDIKKELGEDHISFCCYVPCKFDKWIKICDGAERNKSRDSKWMTSHNIIQKVIEKVTAKYKENVLAELDKAESVATSDVMKEVNDIQNMCRENRRLKELYKIYKTKIENMPEKLQTLDRMPEYKTKMVNSGYLFSDGKRVNGNLTNIARYLEQNCEVPVSERLLQEEFLKPDGHKYSLSACKKALENIHSK
jgi:hypothetical protein